MRNIAWLFIVLASTNAIATTEEEFQTCVTWKDITLHIATKADAGVSRSDMKNSIPVRTMDDLVDWVYDFRGAYSTQQIAQKQMEICLRHLSSSKKR